MSRLRLPPTPRKPEDCHHHRWTSEVELATGKPTGRVFCWHCGTPHPSGGTAAPEEET